MRTSKLQNKRVGKVSYNEVLVSNLRYIVCYDQLKVNVLNLD